MSEAIFRNLILFIGLALAALVSMIPAGAMTSLDGLAGPTVFAAVSPVSGWIMVAAGLALLTVIAIIVTKLVNPCVGLFVLGGGLFALDHQVAGIESLVFHGSFGAVPLETVIWSVLVLIAATAVFTIGGPMKDVEPTEAGHRPDAFRSVDAWRCAAAGALMLPAVMLLAQSTMKGQLIGATIVGGLGAGLVGRMLSPHVQPILLFASPILFGAIGQFVGRMMMGGSAEEAWISGTLPALAKPLPVDLAAGSLLGVSMGIGWAHSFLHHEETPASAPA